MARKKRRPEESARREKIRELLQMANIDSMHSHTDAMRMDAKSYTINLPRLLRPWKRFKLGRVHIKYLFTRALI